MATGMIKDKTEYKYSIFVQIPNNWSKLCSERCDW